MEKRFPDYLKKYMTDNGNKDGWKYYELFLLPYKDVHSNAADIGLDYINYQKFDKNYTNIFYSDRTDRSGDRLHQFHESFYRAFCRKSQRSGNSKIRRRISFPAGHPVFG